MFKTLQDAVLRLESVLRFKPKASLDFLKKALEFSGIKTDSYKKIHVAGTNGKGSTSAFLTHILIEQGLKVGTFTSPYIEKFNDRIRINFIPIEDDKLLKLINYIFDLNERLFHVYQEKLSFFELVFIMSLKFFQDEQVDVVVMEVGIGGKLDATNILNYDVSLITSIGFDHMRQLGNTLELIAENKLGIIKEKNHLITTVGDAFIKQFRDYTLSKHATVNFIDKSLIEIVDEHYFYYMGEMFYSPLLGDYQKDNAVLAIEAILYLYPLIDLDTIRNGLRNTTWPGRLEKIDDLYIDGAHNEHAINALSRNIDDLFKEKNIYIIFSALGDKDIASMLQVLKGNNRHIILTSFEDMRFDSLEKFKTDSIPYIPEYMHAINYVRKIKNDDDVILVTGSLHFISEVRKQLK